MVDRQSFSPEIIPSTRPPRILLADDEAVSRRLLSDALQRSGFEVHQAADGDEALRLAASEAPDLLVLDFEMPRLNGAEICRRLRASEHEELRTLPVVMLTAHTGEAEEISCLQAGANDFVTKPVSRDVLAARIHTQLRLRSMGDELRQRNEELARWRTEHEADLAAAHATQQVLIPTRLPTAERWSFESIYQPVIEIGGDVFGWRPAGEGSWHFWVADATGHGAAAALFTALATQLFRQACETEQEPGAILCTVNREFRKVFRGRAFMTACCALIGPGGELTFSGAGHPPLLVRRANGQVDSFASHKTLLGLADDDIAEQSQTTLEAGDAALLYSDGLFAFKKPGGERFTHENLRETLRAVTPGVAFFDRILSSLQDGTNGEPCDDDIAAIALQRS
ncbi:MAG: SpoIIE family protein phosphatase [Chthoniobacter sp.]|uniref:PP2C family protein-serine/threonine phosphatase n=1 Tax=Chthoniobacter sp. TaxID=2510640 RepID=UPI0032A930BE